MVEVIKEANAFPKSTLTYITRLCMPNNIKRLDIQINLAFNLQFQRDSETNVQIAKDTAKIVQDAQRDSSSMIMHIM
ncbi:hypothetical protein BDQ17DRAFT_1362212, partial [Cyathus striatus]